MRRAGERTVTARATASHAPARRAPGILDLQRMAGNRATANLIQRVGGGQVKAKDGALKVIKDVTAGKATKGTKIDVPLSVTYADDSKDALNINVSHERHLISSYTTKLNETKDNPQNTIAAVSDAEFVQGFEDYSEKVAARIGAQGSAYKPDDPANELDTVAGLKFHSDNKSFGASLHCFPTAGGKARTLDATQFAAFKNVTRLLSITEWASAGSTLKKGQLAWEDKANDTWKAALLTQEQIDQIAAALLKGPKEIAAAKQQKAAAAKAKATAPKE
ncbi:MAG: hypothetical protein IT303_17685 [Dehalococcoidia bacterium]|nr:hypothetical protein [Dehalococcoidia bacterium]